MSPNRDINVSPAVADAMQESQLAHMLSMADDDDNRCGVCEEFIDTPVAEIVILDLGAGVKTARFTHSDCLRSGIYDNASGQGAAARQTQSSEPQATSTRTAIAVRSQLPRALVVIEPLSSASSPATPDPYEHYAEVLGLHPLQGDPAEMTPALGAQNTTVGVEKSTIIITYSLGEDGVSPDLTMFPLWLAVAREDRQVFLIIGYGILSDSAGTLQDALRTRPCWGAAVPFP